VSEQYQDVRVSVQPMTGEAFAPYGEVFGAEQVGRERGFAATGFSHSGRITLGAITQPSATAAFSRLERHFAVTQAFVQLGGAPSVVCVAPPTDVHAPGAVPDPREVVGFIIDPALGYLFHRGTWHSLDRFPSGAGGATFLIVNVDPNPTQIVDYTSGECWMHDDLDALPPRAQPAMRWHGLRFVI
jgi:ureidoglycolate hydrolase